VTIADGGLDCSLCGALSTPCGTQCVDTTSDPGSCGGCGVQCVDGQVCLNGHCTAVCPDGGVCSSTTGLCQASCSPGTAVCYPPGDGGTGFCSNLLTDPSNCGRCGTNCNGCLDGGCLANCSL
jgi:hypothetical protein